MQSSFDNYEELQISYVALSLNLKSAHLREEKTQHSEYPPPFFITPLSLLNALV